MVKSTDRNRLGEVIKTVINMINYIKTRLIKCTLFEKLCQEMDAEHKILLLH
jgi:chemotaxis regulatin CheY-phosphate phosphatase CheZ